MPLTFINLKFQVSGPVVFGSFSGFASRGLFYELVRRVDEGRAEGLHSLKRLSPFSSTPIIQLAPKGPKIVYRNISQDALYAVRFTIFDGRLTKLVLDALLQEGEPLRLIDSEIKIVDVSVLHEEYSRLFEEAKPVKRFMVDFITPTFFRFSPIITSRMFPSRMAAIGVSKLRLEKARRFHPVPEPVLMMRSLTRLWKAFSDRPFNYLGYLSWISSMGVSLAGYPSGIRTRRLYEHITTRKFVVGFVGEVNFSIPEDLYVEKWARITDALLRFAEYSNVGGGRTAGFGMVKYLPKEYYSS